MSHKARTVILFAFALVLALSQGAAQAQVVKPFQISGGGPAPAGISLIPGVTAFHYATGHATDLDEYSCVGMFTLLPLAPPPGATAAFSSAPYCFFTAKDGDVLACTYGDVNNGAAEPGKVTLSPPNKDGRQTAVFIAEFNPVPALCTGRFANVTGGSFLMVAKSAPFTIVGTQTTPFNYTWEGKGSLEFSKGK
jgi:hypothetical protein